MLVNDEVRGKRWDLSMFWTMLALVVIGIVNLYSATFSPTPTAESSYWKTQLYWFFIGFTILILIFFINYRILERFTYLIYALNLAALAIVLVIGRTVLGSKRWLVFGPLTIQPSEFMKITIVWTLAKYFHDEQQREAYGIGSLLMPLLIIVIPVLLVMGQPDLGTALVILATSGSILLFIKIHPRLLLIIAISVSILAPIAYKFGLKDYQRQRIDTFLNPQSDPRGAGYNSIQSMIAVGSGKFLGKGFKKGTQSQLKFLPEHHTDFIFSVFSEEWGFLGSAILLGLYVTLMMNGLRIAYSANDKFGMLFSLGLVGIFFWHVLINIGMTTGIMPVVGVPLPFLSYGGSSLVAGIISIAILTNIANKKSMF